MVTNLAAKAKNNDEVKAKIESGLKHDVEEILAGIGINHSEAIRMFYKQILIHRGIPFELKLKRPNMETLRAMGSVDTTEFESVEDMLKDLKS
jgi:DNA-damage-inducible protein J